MDELGQFLDELRALQPLEQWQRLQGCPFGDDPAILVETRWWEARYAFADRKRTRTMDKFVWLLLNCAGETPRRGKALLDAYDGALLSPETQAAMALEDRLYANLLDACTLYVRTVDPHPSIFGLRFTRMSADSTSGRIAQIVVGAMMTTLCRYCPEKEHIGLVLRALFEGAKAACPDIQPHLMEQIQKVSDPWSRDLMRTSVLPKGL